ncbi:unnamed protein product, partial [marine sediment metagenome]
QIIDWIIHQPLMHLDNQHHYALVHAGIAPQWSIEQAYGYAQEAQTALQQNPEQFLAKMYGNEPSSWSDYLTGDDRLRIPK